jgi:ParB family transcriptional regulator, chromosome partitioning protein
MSVEKGPPRRLGRGLEALLGAAAHTAAPESGTPFKHIPIAEIRPNPYQPRKTFAPEEITELQASLAAVGLLQPVTVRTADGKAGYELIAGERRLRAAKALGWVDIPAIVKEMDDRTALTLALVENLQRTDLDPIEEAEGYHRLTKEFHLTQAEVAAVVGKDRSTVANLLRLLGLPRPVRDLLSEGRIQIGHARAILVAPNERAMIQLAQDVAANDLSVREVERRVRGLGPNGPESPAARPASQPPGSGARVLSPELRDIEDRLRAYLQTEVRVELSGQKNGMISIRFYSADDLDRVLDLVVPRGVRRDPVSDSTVDPTDARE